MNTSSLVKGRKARSLRFSVAWARLCGVILLCILLAASAGADNAIQRENAKSGTAAWDSANLSHNHEIEGYASLTSVNRGGQITFYVNTTGLFFSLTLYRLGWYNGDGGREVMSPVWLWGETQTIPSPDPNTGRVECEWDPTYILTVPNNAADPTDWCSGLYVAKLHDPFSGLDNSIYFVVRDDARSSDFLFQSSVTTHQAYNAWGGKSLYGYNSVNGQPAQEVSFNRPYDGQPPRDWEINMLHFLEREGYDVSYCANIDVHADPTLLLSHRGFFSVGHDEYWSWGERANVEAARDHGVNLAFFSANSCYWQIRLDPSPVTGDPYRTQVCYKEDDQGNTADPFAHDADAANDRYITVQWRHNIVKPPESALLGVLYQFYPVNDDMVIANASHWICAGTNLQNGDTLPLLVGYEADAVDPATSPANVEVIAHSSVHNSDPNSMHELFGYSDMTVYTAASGAAVFATGSIQWSWGLDNWGVQWDGTPKNRENEAAKQITRNVLARFVNLGPPITLAGLAGLGGNAGWWRGTVSVTLTPTDPDGASDVVATYYTLDDGATQTYTAPFTLSGDRRHTLRYWSADRVGHVETARSRTVSIDATPPKTKVTLSNLVTGVQVTLAASDALSGVDKTYYTLDGGPTQTYSKPFLVAGMGTHALTFWSVDVAGNREATHSPSLVVHPSPFVISLSPDYVIVGGPAFTLTVNGTGFVPGATVLWNGAARPTTYVSATVVTAAIPATDLAATGIVGISVRNPVPGGAPANSQPFVINNPTPVIVSLSPGAVTPGGPAFTLTVNGSQFMNGATVYLNGAARATTYVSGTQLRAAIPASDIVTPGTANITVINPFPSRWSNTAILQIGRPNLILTARLARDPVTHEIIALCVLTNVGNAPAKNVWVRTAKLALSPPTTTLPLALDDIPIGGQKTVRLVFPAATGLPGQRVNLNVSGTYIGASFSDTLSALLP